MIRTICEWSMATVLILSIPIAFARRMFGWAVARMLYDIASGILGFIF